MNVINKFSWPEILKMLAVIDKSGEIIYGVPKGGMILAGFLQNAKTTYNPAEATIILDDLVDSGATRVKYMREYPNVKFHALLDKKRDGIDSWVQFPWETDHPMGADTVDQNIIRLLQYIGEDINREGLVDTPKRVIKSYSELFSGYSKDPKDIMTTFAADGYDEIVILKDIELYSMCEHHMLPFVGKAHVAYIPGKRIVGISKLARLVDIYARRLQIQERIGQQVTQALNDYLEPKGAACIIEAYHMCMRMRGVGKQQSVMLTSSLTGAFMSNQAARVELMNLIK